MKALLILMGILSEKLGCKANSIKTPWFRDLVTTHLLALNVRRVPKRNHRVRLTLPMAKNSRKTQKVSKKIERIRKMRRGGYLANLRINTQKTFTCIVKMVVHKKDLIWWNPIKDRFHYQASNNYNNFTTKSKKMPRMFMSISWANSSSRREGSA